MPIVIAFLSLLSLSPATEVVVQSPDSSDVEYRAYLAAHADCVSPTQALLRARPRAAAREKLVNDFAATQKAFLGLEVNVARAELESLLEQMTHDDWSPAERQVFFKTALRRAQLSTDQPDMDRWLNVALTIGYDLQPDHILFPPPLVTRWKHIKQQNLSRKIQVHGLGADWSRILINGVSCTVGSCPLIPQTDVPVRVTWLSDKWQPYTTITKTSRLSHEVPVRRAWVTGDCKSPQFDRGASVFADKQPFFGLSCEKLQVAAVDLTLKPANSHSTIDMFTPPKKTRPLYKSPWLWTGVGTVVAIAVIAAKKRPSKGDKDTSSSYGY